MRQGDNMPELLTALEAECTQRVILKYTVDAHVRELTGREFFLRARRCARALEPWQGKHIGILGGNTPQWLWWFCGIVWAGGVAVLLSPDLDGQELSQRIGRADVECLICDRPVPELDIPVISMDTMPEAEISRVANPSGDALSCLVFTSGTTMEAKAVMLSHRAMVAGICHDVIGVPFQAQLAILPMHHVAGFAAVLNTWYLGRVVCLGEDMRYLLRYLQAMQPDYTLLVPSLLQVLVKRLSGDYGQNRGWNLRLVGCGGARFQSAVVQALTSHKIRVLQSYGATEIGGLGFDYEMTESCAHTIGKPPAEIQVKIEDGELLLRCDSMMSGYYKDPEGTAQVLKDGWYATGDLCEMDERGYLHLLGRKREVIIRSGGENVSPQWIEGRLLACPLIQEVLVSAEGEMLVATVYPDASRQEIQAFVDGYNAQVASFLQIHQVRFSPSPFPKTGNGKIIRQGGSV